MIKEYFYSEYSDSAQRFKEEPECEGDIRWKRACNWCSCNKDGKASCSKKACPQGNLI